MHKQFSPQNLLIYFNHPSTISFNLRLILLTSTVSLYCCLCHVSTWVIFILFAFATTLSYLDYLLHNSAPCEPPARPVWSIGSNPKSLTAKSGSWVEVYNNGDIYEGEFRQGQYSGSGVYNYYISGRYEGDWSLGKYHGYGVETWTRGGRYRGQYREGLRHGCGVYRFVNGDVYEGEWFNGQCHGNGKFSSIDGSKYVGEFKWGARHGLGDFIFRNGDKYSGEYFADKMHGFGVYEYVNGDKYEGGFHEGMMHGEGKYTFKKCEVYSSACNESNHHHGVEEAQEVAHRARIVRSVDDDVKMSIRMASRAANAARAASIQVLNCHAEKFYL